VAKLSDGPQKIYGLAGATLAAYVHYDFPCVHLHVLTIVIRIVQAIATLTVGLIIGLIYMWKLGLVGLGKYLSN